MPVVQPGYVQGNRNYSWGDRLLTGVNAFAGLQNVFANNAEAKAKTALFQAQADKIRFDLGLLQEQRSLFEPGPITANARSAVPSAANAPGSMLADLLPPSADQVFTALPSTVGPPMDNITRTAASPLSPLFGAPPTVAIPPLNNPMLTAVAPGPLGASFGPGPSAMGVVSDGVFAPPLPPGVDGNVSKTPSQVSSVPQNEATLLKDTGGFAADMQVARTANELQEQVNVAKVRNAPPELINSPLSRDAWRAYRRDELSNLISLSSRGAVDEHAYSRIQDGARAYEEDFKARQEILGIDGGPGVSAKLRADYESYLVLRRKAASGEPGTVGARIAQLDKQFAPAIDAFNRLRPATQELLKKQIWDGIKATDAPDAQATHLRASILGNKSAEEIAKINAAANTAVAGIHEAGATARNTDSIVSQEKIESARLNSHDYWAGQSLAFQYYTEGEKQKIAAQDMDLKEKTLELQALEYDIKYQSAADAGAAAPINFASLEIDQILKEMNAVQKTALAIPDRTERAKYLQTKEEGLNRRYNAASKKYAEAYTHYTNGTRAILDPETGKYITVRDEKRVARPYSSIIARYNEVPPEGVRDVLTTTDAKTVNSPGFDRALRGIIVTHMPPSFVLAKPEAGGMSLAARDMLVPFARNARTQALFGGPLLSPQEFTNEIRRTIDEAGGPAAVNFDYNDTKNMNDAYKIWAFTYNQTRKAQGLQEAAIPAGKKAAAKPEKKAPAQNASITVETRPDGSQKVVVVPPAPEPEDASNPEKQVLPPAKPEAQPAPKTKVTVRESNKIPTINTKRPKTKVTVRESNKIPTINTKRLKWNVFYGYHVVDTDGSIIKYPNIKSSTVPVPPIEVPQGLPQMVQ